jgi:hypothetical protein
MKNLCIDRLRDIEFVNWRINYTRNDLSKRHIVTPQTLCSLYFCYILII